MTDLPAAASETDDAPADLDRRVAALAVALARLSTAAAAGVATDLLPLKPAVTGVCGAIAALPPADRAHFAEPLTALLARLDELEGALKPPPSGDGAGDRAPGAG